MVYTETPDDLIVECWRYSEMKELSHLSSRVIRKLAEISLKFEPHNIEPELDKEGNPTRSYHMRSEREIATQKLDTLRKKLPTCFKDLAPYLL